MSNPLRVNSVFLSIQGEGYNVGMAAVFVRFAGCNLSCSWCDEAHLGFTEMTDETLLELVRNVSKGVLNVVVTGGEPFMQDIYPFVQKLKKAGYYICVETNGTFEIKHEAMFDWITISPKGKQRQTYGNEIKVVYEGQDLAQYNPRMKNFFKHYLQPVSTKDPVKNQENMLATVKAVIDHPDWRLSVQTHKLIGVK